jgi:type II secretory pathway pseudopilin PulG
MNGPQRREIPARQNECPPSFTLVEILISIIILALGMLGLGVLFPVVIREQRIGSDTTTGIAVANSARAILTSVTWGGALPNTGTNKHPARSYGGDTYATGWMWRVFRDSHITSNPNSGPVVDGLGAGYPGSSGNQRAFQKYAQGEWYTNLINNDPANPKAAVGAAAIGFPDTYARGGTNPGNIPDTNFYPFAATPNVWPKVTGHVNLSVSQRLYPICDTTVEPKIDPKFVWDFAIQRKPNMLIGTPPDFDDLRAVVFVRRIDTRIRFTGTPTTLVEALPGLATQVPAPPPVPNQRIPVAEDLNGNPTLDGIGGNPTNPSPHYSTIKTCEVEFFYRPNTPAMNHPDRLYIPNNFSGIAPTPAQLTVLWNQMKQPGQKLVDNLGNVYTVVGSGNEPGVAAQTFDGVAGGDYLRVDPPVPVGEMQASPAAPATGAFTSWPGTGATKSRAIWQVCFTPQIPVAVSVFDLFKANGQ